MKNIVTFSFKAKHNYEVAGSRFFSEVHLIECKKYDYDFLNKWAKENLQSYFTGNFDFIKIEVD